MKKITNKQEALEAVLQDGMKLEKCSEKLRSDKDVVEAAVANREKAMMFASEELKCDKEVIQSALMRSTTLTSEMGIAFSFVPEHIKDNEEMALIAISIFHGAFEYFSDRLKKDEAFLIRAVAKNYGILRYLDSKYLKDEPFITKVLNTCPSYRMITTKDFAKLLDVSILDNKNMMKMIIEKAGYENFKYASDKLKKDRSYITEILSIAPEVFKLLDNFHDDKEVTMLAVKEDGMNLGLASWRLQEDKEVVLSAVKNNPHSIQYADDDLQKDEELLSYVTKDDSYYWDIVEPYSRRRYDIPMLSTTEPGYFRLYVRFMRTKEQSPNTFEKILRWD